MKPGDSPQRSIWIDGELVPWAEASVHVLSHSHQRGSLIFDYMSVHETPRGAAVFRLEEHLARFQTSAELVTLPLSQDLATLCEAVLSTVRANPGATAVKISAYLASVEVDVVPVDEHVSVAIAAYDPEADIQAHKAEKPWQYRRALRMWLEKERRNRRRDIMDPHAKVAANYASPMAAKWAARKKGYDEILLIDENGFLAEGPTTNVFLVDGEGTLCTPPARAVLLGVTRRSILELAKHEGRRVMEAPIRPEALMGASEAFLTGTTANVAPIGSVDDQPIGDGDPPGPVTKALAKRFYRILDGEDPDFDHWLAYVEAPGAQGRGKD
jgi:branched-chain amino acid aminotransferase